MRASVGDHIHMYSRSVGQTDRRGEIVEVRGSDGEPPYVVKFEDGHSGLVHPGPDCVIERRAADE
ncbi:DUF1918 domain-containing protein [Streptomyces sp. NPDC088251]|uniref:DUF1918 domain-containing protein n=1 Tax=unclassified Streptomyces TaxID=2593676 RepID=UPI00382D7F97